MKSVKVRVKVSVLRTDPSAYKKYAPELVPQNVFVEVPVDGAYVIYDDGDSIVLTVDGLSAVMKVISNSIAKLEG